jgi:hypothetical protein
MSNLPGELDRLERLLVETIALSAPGEKSGTATININAGGAGMWIVVTCCMVSFVMNIALAVAFLTLNREMADMRDYVNATYMMAPALQEKALKLDKEKVPSRP